MLKYARTGQHRPIEWFSEKRRLSNKVWAYFFLKENEQRQPNGAIKKNPNQTHSEIDLSPTESIFRDQGIENRWCRRSEDGKEEEEKRRKHLLP